MEFKEGDIVKHKLNDEPMLVLSNDGFGASSRPQTRVRIKTLEERWFDTFELKPIKKCIHCGRSEMQRFSYKGCTGPCNMQ
jgi:hypothetical protein